MGHRTARWSLLLALAAPSFAYAHGGHAHIMGTVTAADTNHIEVKEKDGKTVSLQIDDGTKFTLGKTAARKSDAAVGKRVVVHTDGAGNQHAAAVQIGKSPKK